MKPKCIVTLTDGISPTSMPFNEFVLYRLKKYPKEKQIIIQLFENRINPIVQIPKDVLLYSVQMNVIAIWRAVHKIEREYDVKAYHIHEGKSVILFSVATMLTRRKKVVYTLHSTYRNYPIHNKIFSFGASLFANYVVCVSDASFKYYPKILKILKGDKALSIQNGVDINRIKLICKNSVVDKSHFTLVYVARLVPLKQHWFLFDILQKLPDVKLVLIGKGPLERELKVLVKEKGVEQQVEFKGLLSREKVYGGLMEADLYVSTSLYEGLPIGVLEAMGCGLVCLVSDIEQHAEIAQKCQSLFILPFESELWIEKIMELQLMNKDDLSMIGECNKRAVFTHFSLERMHKNYDAIYNSLRV